MRIDNPEVFEGSAITNAVVASGVSFPSNQDPGELFFRTDTSKLNVWNGASWDNITDGLVDPNPNLTTATISDTLRLTSTQDADLVSTLHPFQIGLTSGFNLIADNDEILARNNGAASQLSLNAEGGDVVIGATSGAGDVTIRNGGLLIEADDNSPLRIRNVNESSDPLTPGSTFLTLIDLQNSSSVGIARFGFDGGTDLEITSLARGAAQVLQGFDSSGVNNITFFGDPDGSSHMYDAGNVKISTQPDGATIRGASANTAASGLSQDTYITLANVSGDALGRVGYPNSTDVLFLESFVHGGNVIIQGQDASGTTRTFINMDPDGTSALQNSVLGWEIQHGGTTRISTSSNGANVLGDILDVNNSSSANQTFFKVRNSEGGMQISVDGGGFSLQQTNAAGTFQENWITGAQDGAVSLLFDGATKLATQIGGVTITGTATATTFSGSGASLTSLNASNLSSGTVPDARIAVSSVTQHEGSIDHDALTNFVGDEHIDHSAVTITAGTGLSGGGDITTSRTIDLANTAVTPGSYTSADITVDAQGRITAASSGAGGGVSTVTAGTGLSNSGTANDPILDVGAGTGITVGATTVGLDTANTRNADHSSITLTAGDGLSGGGDITASRTFDVDSTVARVTGTPSNNQVAVWTDSTTVEGTSGLTYSDASLTADSSRFRVFDATDSVEIQALNTAIGGVSLEVLNGSGVMQMRQLSAAGANEDTILAAVRDSFIQLYHNNVAQVRTHSAGLELVRAGGATDASYRAYDTTNGGFALQLDASAGSFQLLQTSGGGTAQDTIIDHTRDAEVGLYHNNTRTARTATAATGGLEVNNTETGGGFERVLTESDNPFNFFGVMTADQAIASSTTLVYPTEFEYALPDSDGDRTYVFEAKLFVTAVSATPGLRTRVDHTGNVAAIISGSDFGQVKVTPASSGGTVNVWSGRADLDVTETGIPLSAAVSSTPDVVEIHGVFRLTNNNPQGDLRIGFAQSTSSADTITIKAGSYFRVKTIA